MQTQVLCLARIVIQNIQNSTVISFNAFAIAFKSDVPQLPIRDVAGTKTMSFLFCHGQGRYFPNMKVPSIIAVWQAFGGRD